MRISIAMCTYNGSSHLLDQLRSFAAQTRLPDELIICDDQSTDSTTAIIERFASSVPFPVHLHINPVRLGTTRNFERAISLCTGDIIFLSDQDDVWLPEKIDRLSYPILSDPTVGLAFSNASVVDHHLYPLGYQLWDALWFTPREQHLVQKGNPFPVFLKHVVAAGTTLAFRASLRDLLLPIPDLRTAHDAWIALLISAVARVVILNESLILYRLHSSNQVGMRKLSLRGQIAQARQQLHSHAFRYAYDLHQAAYARLSTHPAAAPPLHPILADLLHDKIAHSRIRHRMSRYLPLRLPSILRESLNRRYFHFSYGLKSIAQDIFLR